VEERPTWSRYCVDAAFVDCDGRAGAGFEVAGGEFVGDSLSRKARRVGSSWS